MFLNAAPPYALPGADMFSQDALQQATDYAINYGDYLGQQGRAPLRKKTPVNKKTQIKSSANLSKPGGEAIGKTMPAASADFQQIAPQNFDIKNWLQGSVYVAGHNVPRKVLVGVAVSGVLLLILTSLGKKTVIAAVN
jgi:hypothetical protein